MARASLIGPCSHFFIVIVFITIWPVLVSMACALVCNLPQIVTYSGMTNDNFLKEGLVTCYMPRRLAERWHTQVMPCRLGAWPS